MTEMIVTNRRTAILGMGATGLSVARFLSSIGMSFVFIDSRNEPPNLDQVRSEYPHINMALGPFDKDFLTTFDRVDSQSWNFSWRIRLACS